jgi:DNA recombination protein RmuC
VVINLPDGKKMIVDSKVSLTAYEKYINEEDDELKTAT